MMNMLGVVAYVVFVMTTAILVWAVGVLANSADAKGECEQGTNPHGWRF